MYPVDISVAFSFQYIDTLDMFFEQNDFKFPVYADNNAPYFFDEILEGLHSELQTCALKLIEWFSDNYRKMNSVKCHLTLSSNAENKKIKLNGEIQLNNTQMQRLLAVHIDYKLKFDTHIETLVVYV